MPIRQSPREDCVTGIGGDLPLAAKIDLFLRLGVCANRIEQEKHGCMKLRRIYLSNIHQPLWVYHRRAENTHQDPSEKYLNNIVEQDHWAIKRRIRPMLGFKKFNSARVLLNGIESCT
jgi:hypothetical protein